MRIPNAYSVFVAAAFVVAFVFSPASFGPWWHHVGGFVLMFGVTFWMFSAGMIGSADTKLGSVLALWVGLKGLIVYLLAMTLMGGLLGGAALLLRRKKFFAAPRMDSWMARAQAGESVVPYGVAISFGFWVFVLHTGLLHHLMDEVYKIIH
jgi:Flp pilus assembly protein protease CpaA